MDTLVPEMMRLRLSLKNLSLTVLAREPSDSRDMIGPLSPAKHLLSHNAYVETSGCILNGCLISIENDAQRASLTSDDGASDEG